jgi:hypothetical protein
LAIDDDDFEDEGVFFPSEKEKKMLEDVAAQLETDDFDFVCGSALRLLAFALKEMRKGNKLGVLFNRDGNTFDAHVVELFV